MQEWDGLLPPVSCGDRPIIDGVRTPVAYSTHADACHPKYTVVLRKSAPMGEALYQSVKDKGLLTP